MKSGIEELLHAYLDNCITPEEFARLSEWIKADPANARRFAREALLHDRLRDRFVGIEAEATEGRPSTKLPGRRPVLLAAAAILLVAALTLIPALTTTRASAAEAVLDRLIAAAARSGDRTYRIVALDPDPLPEARGRGRVRPPIDGAILHVRGNSRYVLIRRPGTTEAFVTGSNGREAWSVPPDGPVRVSPDPARFRGALPGEQQGLPFLDLPTALVRLRAAYDLELRPGEPSILRAIKRSSAFRGPREVEVHSDPATGLIREIRLAGLPMAQGGPRTLAMELVHADRLDDRVFEHESHHDAERRVIQEAQE